jgi:subtilase family serine protease
MKTSTFFRGLLILLSGALTSYTQTVAQSAAVSPFQSHRMLRSYKAQHMQHTSVADRQQSSSSSAACLAEFGTLCYSPQDIRQAYGIAPLIDAGYSGHGQTIVIIVSFGSPTIEQDLKQFDAAFGLPDPPSLSVQSPLGTVAFDPNNADHLGWAGETSLDVEWAHALAPDAGIVILTSPVSETQGIQGLPEFLKLEKYALDHHLGQIISQSWGTAENTLFDAEGQQLMQEFEQLYERAAAEHVTILAGAGDSGTENVDVNNNPYPFPTVVFPASSPFATAVGGTSLQVDDNGDYKSETVWNSFDASGGGVSQVFAEPAYQRSLKLTLQGQLWGHRGLPDVALTADPYTAGWVYFGFFADPNEDGFVPMANGVSWATPLWAGIIADANQMAGRPLGFLNPLLYAIGAAKEQSEFFHDITVGNNAYNGLPGYSAARGWDLASGWGTPKLGKLLWELCH